MNRDLSVSERIHRAVTSTETEKVMATHAYLHGASRAKEEWTTIWSRRDDISWAHAFGRMRGWDSVWAGSVGDYDVQTYDNYKELIQVYPETIGMDPRPLMVNSMHPLTNGIIEVAEDGETARCSYLTPGLLYAILDPSGERFSMMLWERYGADFRYEDGKLLYIHDQVCPDLFAPMFDVFNLAVAKYGELKHPELHPPVEPSRPRRVTDPGPLHIPCSPVQPVQNSVPWPEPYQTLDNNNTYTKCPEYGPME